MLDYSGRAMSINSAVTAIDEFLKTYPGAVTTRVLPSGDDMDVIKIWIDLGSVEIERKAWTATCEAAIRKAVPSATPFRLFIFAESGDA